MVSSKPESGIPDSLKNRKFKSIAKSKLTERFVTAILGLCALISVATTTGIVFVLVSESSGFFLSENVSLAQYLEASPLFTVCGSKVELSAFVDVVGAIKSVFDF